VRSAAAAASPDSVAPGSLISVYGANLAPDTQAGPVSPLAQTLKTVTVRVDDSFLPLVFVSPCQINAQIPAGITEGNHKITVRWEGKPEASAPVSVVRNAPGLFSDGQQDQPIGLFVRADGSAISKDRPARPGETVTLLGTGLGAYTLLPPDGFLLDEGLGYALADPVTVLVGEDAGFSPLYAGRSGVAVGIDSVRFQVGAGWADGPVPVRIRVNGKESNTVFLPVSR